MFIILTYLYCMYCNIDCSLSVSIKEYDHDDDDDDYLYIIFTNVLSAMHDVYILLSDTLLQFVNFRLLLNQLHYCMSCSELL